MGRDTLALTPAAVKPPSNTAAAGTALAPGFRFHPTDEELVSYYLKRKVLNKPVRFNAIGEVDIYKHEPWELAGSLPYLCLSIDCFLFLLTVKFLGLFSCSFVTLFH